MLGHRGGQRVPVVVKPVDRALGALRLGLVPLLVLLASAPALDTVSGSGALSHGWPLAVAGIVTVVAYALLLQTPLVGGRVDLALARLRRRVVMSCDPPATHGPGDVRLACCLIPEALRAPLFRYDEQRTAVQMLVTACRADNPGQFWFLEGSSGSGKTRTGLLLVQALVRDFELLRFGDSSYLYDFGVSEATQDLFVKHLTINLHENAVVLVDNFQLVGADVLSDVTTQLLDRPSRRPERLILFLTRPADSWNLSPGSEVRLVSQAKALDHHLELHGPPTESIARSLASFDDYGSQLVRDLQDGAVATAPQLHIAQVIARNRTTPPEVTTILRLLECDAGDATAFGLIRVLAMAAALSMYSGAFGPKAFRHAAFAISSHDPPYSTPGEVVQIIKTARRLSRIGLLGHSIRQGQSYEFHESLAKLCIDRLWALPAFQVAFTIVGRERLQRLLSAGDFLTAWLVAVEVGAQEVVEEVFDAAMASGPYTRMLRCLRRASNRYELSAHLRLQLAILLDRTGEFIASREEFTDELMETLDPASELAVMFAATRLEASHDRSTAGLELLRNSPNRLYAIIGEYWTIHIAAHRGEFCSGRLLALATEALRLLEAQANPSHWMNHSLARLYFDSLRHHYLEGGTPLDAVTNPERRALSAYLRRTLPTYEAFESLYTKAHVVGQALLPQLGIFKEDVTAQQAALAGVELKDIALPEDMIATARHLYLHAQGQFALYGDREAAYLQADVLYTEMIANDCDLDALTVKLWDYERFVQQSGFVNIASYPHLYFLRWHVLQHYRAVSQGRTDADRRSREHLSAAWQRWERVVELDTNVYNEYGLMRARLLEMLLRTVEKAPDPAELESLAKRMASQGYGREERLLTHLARQRPLVITQTRDVFRFYPFVGQ